MGPLDRSVPLQSEGRVAQVEHHEHNGTTKNDKEHNSRSPSSRDTDSRKQKHRPGSQSRSHRSPSRSQDNDTKRRRHRRHNPHSSKSRSTSTSCSRSRSRSPSRDRRRRRRRHSRSSSRRRYPGDRRSDEGYDYHDRRTNRHRPRNGGVGGDRHPRRRHNNNRRRTPSPSHHRIISREREIANLDRESRTVFASNLNLRADERDLFAFFSTAGPLVDIKIIKDRYTGKSKGIAYIEFDNRDSVAAALALTGQPINGQPVMVKASEAEKNAAWKVAEEQKRAARAMGLQGPGAVVAMHAAQAAQGALGAMGVPVVPPPPAAAAGAFIMNGGTTTSDARLMVSNLHPSITETDLKPIFEPFGPINHVSMQNITTTTNTGDGGRNNTNNNTTTTYNNNSNSNTAGCATVEYTNVDDAKRAAESLQGLDIAGHKISITLTLPLTDTTTDPNAYVDDANTIIPPAVVDLPEKLEGDATDGGGMKLTAQTRAALMTRLAVGAGLKVPTPTIPGPSTLPTTTPGVGGGGMPIPERLALEQGVLGPASPIPTQCLLLKNMFDPAEETEEGWSEDIAEDVRGECAKYGEVVFLHVDTESRGLVYLKFGSVQAAVEAQKAMHGRWFGARQLAADYQFTQIFNAHFGLN